MNSEPNLLNAKMSDSFHGGPSYSISHRLFRVLWALAWLMLCRWTPAPLHRWRVVMLRLFGAKISSNVHVYASARIWYPPNLVMMDHACLAPGVNCYNMAMIIIGVNAIVSQNSFLCTGTHDVADEAFQLKVSPITIGDYAWVASEAFVGPGVDIGEGAVLGARGVTTKNLDPWTVYFGNPAIAVKHRKVIRKQVS